MLKKVFPGAWYIEALPNGDYAALYPNSHIETSRGIVSLPRTDAEQPTENVLYLRCSNMLGNLQLTGQGHGSGWAWLHNQVSWIIGKPASHGVSPCIFDNTGALFVATIEQGSQGYRYCNEQNQLITGDATYANPALQLGEYTTLGGINIGQHAYSVEAVTHERRVIDTGDVQFIRFNKIGSACAVAYHKPAERVSVAWWFLVEELSQFPLETPVVDPPKPEPPIIIPPLVPPVHPPEVGMKLPDHVYSTLVSVRAKYPTPLGNQGAAVVNEVAWIHRAEGYGLESKPGGNSCPQPKTGEMCGCDILRTANLGWDVLGDSEGAGVPNQSESGPADPNRFVQPVDPGTVVIPPIEPPVEPPSSDLAARVAALEAWRAQIRAVS